MCVCLCMGGGGDAAPLDMRAPGPSDPCAVTLVSPGDESGVELSGVVFISSSYDR